MAVLASWLASCRDYRDGLAPGEWGRVLVVSSTRDRANEFDLICGVFSAAPALRSLVVSRTASTLSLSSNIEISVRPASFRSSRGSTAIAVLADEIAFWRSDESANPDLEILRALRPSLATTGGPLCAISSPYAKKGELWKHYSRHFGKAGSVLVACAATKVMNATISDAFLASEYEKDPESARAEYGAEFRDGISQFISREAVEACISPGVLERAPVRGLNYHGFVDTAGGGADSFTMAISHLEDGVSILDCVREVRPPFSPEGVVEDFCGVFASYWIGRIRGDNYAGDWPKEQFRKRGVDYFSSDLVRSDLYRELLPLINSRRIDLLDDKKLLAQLCSLERRAGRGKDIIDHPRDCHDDLVNAAAGAMVAAAYIPRGPFASVGAFKTISFNTGEGGDERRYKTGKYGGRVEIMPEWVERGERFAPDDQRSEIETHDIEHDHNFMQAKVN
jgi:hypothetical protein